MSVNLNTAAPINMQPINLQGMDIETALMMVQSQRANLLEAQLKDQIEAVQKKNDEISKLNVALGALNEATRSGISIPRDAGLTGFGDITTLVDVTPGLTTVRVPTGQLARLGLDLALTGPGDGSGSIAVDVTPVLRDSTPARN